MELVAWANPTGLVTPTGVRTRDYAVRDAGASDIVWVEIHGWGRRNAIGFRSPRLGLRGTRFVPDRDPLVGIRQYWHAIWKVSPAGSCFYSGGEILRRGTGGQADR